MAFSRRTLSVLTLLIVVALVAGGIWWRLRPEGEDGGEAQAAETAAEEAGIEVESATREFSTDIPTAVVGAPAIRDTLWISVRASGNAEAFRRATLQAQVDGVVGSVPVKENTRVSRGQVVLQIDTAELALEVAQARSELLNARAEFQSMTALDDEIDDPEVRRQREQIARAQSGLNSAEVALEQAQLQLERATVRAPFEGRIADLEVVPGQHVSGAELMTVVDLDPIKVEAEVLEGQLGLLEEGRRANVTFAAFPGETFQGRIETINPVIDVENRTARVTILLANPDHRIKPGMYAEVSMEAQAFPDRVLVPRSALLERDRRDMVFVYEEQEGRGLAKWRYVNPGRQNEEYVELLPPEEGPEDGWVEPGETVLVDNHHYLAHDTRIRLVEDVTGTEGRPSR